MEGKADELDTMFYSFSFDIDDLIDENPIDDSILVVNDVEILIEI